MKTLLRMAFALSLVLSPLATQAAGVGSRTGYGAGGNFGLGAILGDPTGITAKLWTASPSAYDFGLAFSFGDYFLFYSDYLYHFPRAFGQSSEFISELTPYVGIGGLIAFSTDSTYRDDRRVIFRNTHSSLGLGVRIPLGIEWRPHTAPIGVFVEIVPGLALVPRTDGFIQGGIGARFYF